MTGEQQYAQGGYVGGPDVPVALTYIHPDECIIAKRGDTFVCIREHNHGSKR